MKRKAEGAGFRRETEVCGWGKVYENYNNCLRKTDQKNIKIRRKAGGSRKQQIYIFTHNMPVLRIFSAKPSLKGFRAGLLRPGNQPKNSIKNYKKILPNFIKRNP